MRYNENMLIADGFFKENFLEMMKVVRLWTMHLICVATHSVYVRKTFCVIKIMIFKQTSCERNNILCPTTAFINYYW
jgi:hypothetical protein